MDTKKDYYTILGVLPSIDDVALTAACRALLKKYHPDVSQAQNNDGRAADIIEAYRVLGSPDKRKAYDRARQTYTWSTSQENTWSTRPENQESTSSASQESTWSTRPKNAWSAKQEKVWQRRRDDLRSEKTREKPSLASMIAAMWLANLAVRSLITACVIAYLFTGLGPNGTLLTDTVKSFQTLSKLGNVNFTLPLGGDRS